MEKIRIDLNKLGIVVDDEEAKKRVIEYTKAREQARIREIVNEANFPQRSWELVTGKIKGFKKELVLESVREYISRADKLIDEKKGLFLVGGVGIGKTVSILYAIKQVLLKRRLSVKYIKAYELEKIHNQYYDKETRNIYNDIKKYPILFIDDVGYEGKQKWSMLDIIDYRYETYKITYMASNMRYEDLKELIGDAGMSRLKASMIFSVIDKGYDLRQMNK